MDGRVDRRHWSVPLPKVSLRPARFFQLSDSRPCGIPIQPSVLQMAKHQRGDGTSANKIALSAACVRKDEDTKCAIRWPSGGLIYPRPPIYLVPSQPRSRQSLKCLTDPLSPVSGEVGRQAALEGLHHRWQRQAPRKRPFSFTRGR